MKLIFVYNAKAGLLNGVMDSIHKIVSPDTYECALCAVTYGVASMKKDWRAYLKTLPVDVHFYHKADFLHAHPDQSETDLPAIGIESGDQIEILVGAAAIKKCTTVGELIVTLDGALSGRSFGASKR